MPNTVVSPETQTQRYVVERMSRPLLFRTRTSACGISPLTTSTIVRHPPYTMVLQRPKFDRYVTIVARIITNSLTTVVVDIAETIQVCRDPKDDKFLEIAVNGKADIIVTGDPDLLILHPFRDIAIRTPDALYMSFRLQSNAPSNNPGSGLAGSGRFW